MKLVWFGIFMSTLAIVFTWKRQAGNVTGAPPAQAETDTSEKIPTPVGVPLPSASSTLAPPPRPSADILPQIAKIQEIARYALPSREKRQALIQSLSDRHLHTALQQVLTANDTEAFDASHEKLRMNAVSVLGLILRYPEVNHRDDVSRWVKQRILAVDFDRMKDLKVKQSVYGDITELLMILRQYDPESFEDVSRQIAETKNKALKTALAASR